MLTSPARRPARPSTPHPGPGRRSPLLPRRRLAPPDTVVLLTTRSCGLLNEAGSNAPLVGFSGRTTGRPRDILASRLIRAIGEERDVARVGAEVILERSEERRVGKE